MSDVNLAEFTVTLKPTPAFGATLWTWTVVTPDGTTIRPTMFEGGSFQKETAERLALAAIRRHVGGETISGAELERRVNERWANAPPIPRKGHA